MSTSINESKNEVEKQIVTESKTVEEIMVKDENSINESEKFESTSEVEGNDTEKTDDKKDNKDKNTLEQNKDDADDPYAYLERGEFTTEKFKIEIRGLPRFYGIGELRTLLNNRLNLCTAKIKSPKARNPWAYVCFRNEEDKLRAINILNGYRWKGKKLSAKEAKPMPDPLVKKRKENELLSPEAKKQKIEETVEERLKKTTIPFWNIPYVQQLKLKQEETRSVLQKLANDIEYTNPNLQTWLNKQLKENDGLPCQLWNLRYSTKTDGYRNKCEFTVGKSEVNGEPTVGFRFGGYAAGITSVGPVDGLVHIPNMMKVAVKLFEKYVRSSNLEIFDPELQTGHFRQLTARYASSTNQLMLIVCIHPQQLTEQQIASFKQDLTEFFTEGEGKEAKISSLYYQTLVKRNPGEAPPLAEHLYGDVYIYETILGLKFRVSPEAFFQINTEAAEILYSTAIELANPSPDSTVVDICCGTGSIGLCFAKKCSQVLGLEIVPQAVANAKENAIENNITNAEFFQGAAEDIISSVMYRAQSDDIIAIVDPPRAGLHQRAIELLRKTDKLKKLVYIACNPQSASKNFLSLSRPASKTMHGDPFVPVRAVAVDMFPYTKHLELLIYFERLSTSNSS